jgi:hypothetical protein
MAVGGGQGCPTPVMRVLPIKNEETHDWLLRVHYAKRIPSISYAFGLFNERELVGIVTYGTPPSPSLCEGVAGKNNVNIVLELNRLAFVSPIQNGPSLLVSHSLKLLPKPTIVVSYADCAQGHVGYVYQATNFLYTGLSAKRTDWKIKGMEHLHGKTVANMAHGQENPAEYMRARFGDDFYLEDRPRKHRYIYICADKKDRKRLQSELLYPIEPYPKGDSSRYDISYLPATQGQLF